MSLTSKILIGFVFLATLPFAYMAARTLKTHQQWRDRAQNLEQQIEETQQKVKETVYGIPGETPSITGLRVQLHQFVNDMGRVWKECTHNNVVLNDETGQLTLNAVVGEPEVHNITAGTSLFVFEGEDVLEGGKRGGKYLGEFRVAEDPGGPDAALLLARVENPSPQQADAIRNSGSEFWILFDTMPLDSHQVFAGANQEELPVWLPQATLDEYLRDGTDQLDPRPDRNQVRVKFKKPYEAQLEEPGEGGGPPVRRTRQFAPNDEFWFRADEADQLIADGIAEELERKYVRPLRDYAALFAEHSRKVTVLDDLTRAVRDDLQYSEGAKLLSEAQFEQVQGQIVRLKAERTHLETERSLAEARLEQLERYVKKGRDGIQYYLSENEKLFRQLRSLQEKAVGEQGEATTARRGS